MPGHNQLESIGTFERTRNQTTLCLEERKQRELRHHILREIEKRKTFKWKMEWIKIWKEDFSEEHDHVGCNFYLFLPTQRKHNNAKKVPLIFSFQKVCTVLTHRMTELPNQERQKLKELLTTVHLIFIPSPTRFNFWSKNSSRSLHKSRGQRQRHH